MRGSYRGRAEKQALGYRFLRFCAQVRGYREPRRPNRACLLRATNPPSGETPQPDTAAPSAKRSRIRLSVISPQMGSLSCAKAKKSVPRGGFFRAAHKAFGPTDHRVFRPAQRLGVLRFSDWLQRSDSSREGRQRLSPCRSAAPACVKRRQGAALTRYSKCGIPARRFLR